jgi:hypothetical protein
MVLDHLKLAAGAFAKGLAVRAVAFAEDGSEEPEPEAEVEPPAPDPLPIPTPAQPPTIAQTIPLEAGENTSDFLEWWKEQEMLRQFHPNSPLIDNDYDRMQIDSLPPIQGIKL